MDLLPPLTPPDTTPKELKSTQPTFSPFIEALSISKEKYSIGIFISCLELAQALVTSIYKKNQMIFFHF